MLELSFCSPSGPRTAAENVGQADPREVGTLEHALVLTASATVEPARP